MTGRTRIPPRFSRSVLRVLLALFLFSFAQCGPFPQHTPAVGGTAPSPASNPKLPHPTGKESSEATVSVDASAAIGKFPEIFSAGMFLHPDENSLPEAGRDYLREKFLSDQKPGMTTIFVNLGAGDSYEEYRRNVERNGALLPASREASAILGKGGKVLFDLETMPSWLSRKPPGEEGEFWRYPPKNYDTWKDLVAFTAGYFYRQGIRGAGYRIWEEVDIGLTKDLRFWNGTTEEFLKLYEYTVRGIRSVDPDAKVTFGLAATESPILRDMVNFTAKKSVPLDYIVWHPFKALPFPGEYRFQTNLVRDLLRKAGTKSNVALHAESWNSWLEVDKPALRNGWPDERSSERDTESNAAFIVQTLYAMDAAGISHQSFFARVDPMHRKHREAGSVGEDQQFLGDFGIFTKDLVVKPAYNSFRALSLLSGVGEKAPRDRLSVSFDPADLISAIASSPRDRGKIHVLISYYLPTGRILKDGAKQIQDDYSFGHYGDAFNPFASCLKDGNLKKCAPLAPPDLRPFFECIAGGGGEEKCSRLVPEHLRRFNEKLARSIQGGPKRVVLKFRNLPIRGSAKLTTYSIDENLSNACRYNRRTGSASSGSPCGINGEIDRRVREAREEAVRKSLETVAMQPNLRDQAGRIAETLFFHGQFTTPSGSKVRTSRSIDSINRDPNVSFEGSRKTREIAIGNDGTFRMEIPLSPYSVVLLEISRN